MILLWACSALAAEVELHGDVKTFGVASYPYEWVVLSEASEALLEQAGIDPAALGFGAEPQLLGVVSGRLKLAATAGPFTLDVHHAVSAQGAARGQFLPGTGAALEAPQLVDLDWRQDLLVGRTDRLVLAWQGDGVTVAAGRQPITFGTGLIFTPMDVVNPFHPATIDTEYKPGVDALRVDAFFGVSGRATAVAAWVGEGEAGLEDVILAANGQATVGVTDLIGLVALVREEPVLGAGLVSSAGPVGFHGDATLTLAEDPFVRAVVGADWRPTGTTTLSGEAYVQTFGAASPEGYLDVAASERFTSGEVWQMGRYYGAVSLSQEITPLIVGSLAVIGNLADPSALLAPGVSWSVADNAVVAFGGYLGLGARPDPVEVDLSPPSQDTLAASVNSEFGLYPHAAYLQMRAYF